MLLGFCVMATETSCAQPHKKVPSIIPCIRLSSPPKGSAVAVVPLHKPVQPPQAQFFLKTEDAFSPS